MQSPMALNTEYVTVKAGWMAAVCGTGSAGGGGAHGFRLGARGTFGSTAAPLPAARMAVRPAGTGH